MLVTAMSPHRRLSLSSPTFLPGLLLGALVVFLLAVACGGAPRTAASDPDTPTRTPAPAVPDFGQNAQDAQRGGTLILANRGDPPAAFDTMRTSSIALHHIGGGVFGPGNLVRRCRENIYLVCADLAENWQVSQDFTEWTFSIRPGVTWHDGIDFTAEDVKFWFDMSVFGVDTPNGQRAPAYFKGELGDVTSVEVLPFNRVRISLSQRSPHLLEVLANPRLKIAHPAHLMKERIEQGEVSLSPLDVGLIGTGPFVFESYKRGSLLQVRRNPDYWEIDALGQSLPYLDGIDFVIMPDPTSMDAAIRTGRVDGGARGEGHYLSVERKVGYDRDLKDTVYYGEMQGGLFRLAFNLLKPGPWQDVRVRQAMSLWIDKGAAIPSALGGFGYLSPILGPTNPFTSLDFKTWPRFNADSIEEARTEAQRLMADAGYANGFAMGHLCRGRISLRCEFLQAQLAGLNIDLQLQVVDEGEWNRARTSLDFDSQQGAFFTTPIPEGTESVFGRYSQNPDAYTKHEDEKIETLYDRMRATAVYEERSAIWRDLERYIVLDQSYVIPIAGTLQVVPYRTYVRGVAIPPEDGHTHTDFATVWLNR